MQAPPTLPVQLRPFSLPEVQVHVMPLHKGRALNVQLPVVDEPVVGVGVRVGVQCGGNTSQKQAQGQQQGHNTVTA